MFRRLREILAGTPIATPPVANQQYAPSTEEFTFETLWDEYERRTWHYNYAKATLEASNPRLLNWIGSIDRSGYTREKCLRALISSQEPGDENRILLRLSDWVSPVQVLARDWVLTHFHSLPFAAVRSNQRLILYLSRKDRLQDDAGMHEIERDLLARTRAMTPSQFFGLNAMFRRFLFSVSFANDQQLRPLILDDPDPFNRLLLLSEFEFSKITGDERRRINTDKSVFVRRRLFHTQLEAGISPDRDELITLALDSNRSLRELGQFYLKSNFGEDAYAIYRGLVGEEFFYIADFARGEDAEHFLEGVRIGSRLTQYNCLRALASAFPERIRELIVPALISQSRKFRSILLPLLPGLLSVEEILALRPAFGESSPRGTISYLRVLERKSFWTFVDEGLAVLLSDPEPALRQMIVRSIHSKVANYESLSSQRRDTISSKISKLRDHDRKRNEGVVALLEFTMKTAHKS
jgi:hypothetical protein